MVHWYRNLKKIDTYLGINTTVAVTNGTMAMQLGMRALDLLEGEVITTPFSWVANCNAIQWERCQPVFVDVDPESFNINPDKIEAAITKKEAQHNNNLKQVEF